MLKNLLNKAVAQDTDVAPTQPMAQSPANIKNSENMSHIHMDHPDAIEDVVINRLQQDRATEGV